MKTCFKCNGQMADDMIFCQNCGAKLDETDIEDNVIVEAEIEEVDTTQKKKCFLDMIKGKIAECWNKMDLFCKILTIIAIVTVLQTLFAFSNLKVFPIIFSILQIAGSVVSILLYKDIIRTHKWVKFLILGLTAFFVIINVSSNSWNFKNSYDYSSNLNDEFIEENDYIYDEEGTESKLKSDDVEATDFTIQKGTEYAYMRDEWNVYIATAISESIIKIENWNKTLSSSKKVEFEYEVGTYKINDPEIEFKWLDESNSVFTISLTDKNDSKFKNGKTVFFTINTVKSDKQKGSNCDEKIANYTYTNDDWHKYMAIPLTENLIKIEAWYRASSASSFNYGYDVCIVDLADNEYGFEWSDTEKTSFTITMKDEQNKSYWKNSKFIAFTLDNKTYDFKCFVEYLDSIKVGEGEVAAPSSASSYKYKNYKDVEKELKNVGFTNISTKIKYDIVWGWTSEGEIASVSIDGKTDFAQGEVFKKDAPIVITYHMKEEDDPNKPKEESTESKTSSASTTNKPDDVKDETVSYSTNTIKTVKKGNSGIYSYKSHGGIYDNYYVVDFNEGYVYFFSEGNGDETCLRGRINSGDLNSVVIVNYIVGNEVWKEGLHFKRKNQPDHLIMQDHNGLEYDFYTTNLENALKIKDKKKIIE